MRLAAAILAASLALQADPVLGRDPASLPRAGAERWQGFFDPERFAANAAALDEPLRAGLARAQELCSAEDVPAALGELFLVLEREPDLPPGWLLLGTCYFRLRRYSDAAYAYERFLALAPSESWRTQGLAHAYYSLGRYGEARAHYERVLAQRPDSVEALRGLALAHLRLGEAARALELLGRVLALEPAHADALTWRAKVLLELDRAPEALVDAERACALAPWEPAPWYARLQILYELERADEARSIEARWRAVDAAAQRIRRLEEDLRTSPGRADLLASLAREQAALGDAGGLRATLARLERARPPELSPARLQMLALDLLEQSGDEAGARRAAAALAAVSGDDPLARARLSRYRELHGDPQAVDPPR